MQFVIKYSRRQVSNCYMFRHRGAILRESAIAKVDNFNNVRTLHDAKLILSNQHYRH
jgi:hypothetical protein